MPSTGCIKLVSLYKSKYCWTLSKVRYMESSINLPIRVDIVIPAHQETISNSATYKYHNLLILLHIISLPQIPWRYSVSGSIQCCSFLWFQTKRHNVSSLQWNNAMLSTGYYVILFLIQDVLSIANSATICHTVKYKESSINSAGNWKKKHRQKFFVSFE